MTTPPATRRAPRQKPRARPEPVSPDGATPRPGLIALLGSGETSPAGRKFGRVSGSMSVTGAMSERLARLPLWIGLEAQQDYVIERCRRALGR